MRGGDPVDVVLEYRGGISSDQVKQIESDLARWMLKTAQREVTQGIK